MSHQVDPKTTSSAATAMVVAGGNDVDDEWVYLDESADAGKAAAVSKGKEVVEEEEDGKSSGEEGYSDDEEDEDEEYSDYSNEGRLEKAYESGEDVDQVYEYDGAVVDDVGDAVEEGESGEEACSDDDFSDYSGEGRLEKLYESDEDVDQVYGSQADAAEEEEEEDGESGEEACSDDDFSDYSGEGRLEKLYESDEDVDQVYDILKEEVARAAAPRAGVVVDTAACATDAPSDGAAAATNFFDYYYDQYYNDYFGYGRSSGYGAGGGGYSAPSSGYGPHGGVGGYFGGGYYGYGAAGGGGYYGAGYGYGGAGLPPRPAYHPYYMPCIGMYPLLPVLYEMPYTAAPAPVLAPQPPGQYGIVYIPNPALSPTAPAPPQPQP